jgi:hypothetical protein
VVISFESRGGMNKLHLVGNIRSCSFRYMLSTVDKSIADLKEDEAFLELEISYSQVLSM